MIRISTLGRFTVEVRTFLPQRQRHHQTLSPDEAAARVLACLLSNERRVYREQLLTALAPKEAPGGTTGEIPGNRLDRAIHTLRRWLEPLREHPRTSQMVQRSGLLYELAPQAVIWEDAEAFTGLAGQVMTSLPGGLVLADEPFRAITSIEQALTLYHGSYLPAFGEACAIPHLLARRQALQRLWITLQLQLADWWLLRGADVKALEPLQHLLAVDPSNEAACQRLMKAYLALHRPQEAVEVYQRCVQSLATLFHVHPLAQTQVLYEVAQRGAGE